MSIDQPNTVPAIGDATIPAQPTGGTGVLPPAPSVPPTLGQLFADRPRAVHLGAAALMVIGTLMPWVSVFFFKVSGMDYAYGTPFWCALATLGLVAASAKVSRRWLYRTGVILLPAWVAYTAIFVLVSASSVAPDDNDFFNITVSPGPGVFITAAAAVTCLVMVGKQILRERRAEQNSQ